MKNIFIIIFLLLINSCRFYTEVNKKTELIENKKLEDKKTENNVRDYKLSDKWNNFKNFFYGIDQNNLVLKEYQKKEWYLESIKKIKKMEVKLNERKNIIQNWHIKNLQETYSINDAIYLLSGADLFYFTLFYPNAENYVMIAMENTGRISEEYTEEDLKYGMLNIQNIISNLTNSGYLFSRVMKEYMIKHESENLSGTLPVILYFIGYFNYNIIDVYSICLSYKKSICLIPAIHYKIIDSNHKVRNIYYISKRLDPEDFKNNSVIDNFIKNFKTKGLFLKAAVYLLHFKKYYNANIYLTQNFNVIVQDDSGIPYDFLKQSNFTIKLFGQYKDPTVLKETINPFQKTLYEDFKKNRNDLPFSFGYAQARKSNLSNLIYAYKL
jgi:hypothetical protein